MILGLRLGRSALRLELRALGARPRATLSRGWLSLAAIVVQSLAAADKTMRVKTNRGSQDATKPHDHPVGLSQLHVAWYYTPGI